jgi:uncharacterized repeat protein (TIGR03847 family)
VSDSFDLPEPERFTAGTVGEPGHRFFFLQAVGDGELITLRCEKQQVGALAEYLARVLADLPTPDEVAVDRTPTTFVEPAADAWIVGSLGVAWDEEADRLVLVAEEAITDEEIEAGGAPASARFRLTRTQVAAFIEHARDLVAAGRPPCYLCGMPMDPAGHDCPRLN